MMLASPRYRRRRPCSSDGRLTGRIVWSAVFGLLPLLALAQPEEPSPPLDTIPVQPLTAAAEPAPRSAPPAAMETLVVTAGRRVSRLEDTPVSVSITSDEALRETNITDTESLSDRLPNAQVAVTPTNTFFFVRGLGTGSVRSAEQSVGFFVDNVFLGRPQGALFDFLDVEQVELLRGPQGALLGKNTVAGAINIQTAPVTFVPEGYLDLLTGSDGQRRARGAYSTALSDTLAARVAYSQTDEDGVLFNTTQQRDDLGRPGRAGRLKLRWEPRADLTFDASLQAARLRQTGDGFELSQASDALLSLYRRFDPETRADVTDGRTHTDHAPSGAHIEGEDVALGGEWTTAVGRWRLLINAARQDTLADFDLDVSPVPLLNFPSQEAYRQRSTELRFDGDRAWGTYSVGVYLFRADLDLQVDIRAFEGGVDALLGPLAGGVLGPALGELLDDRLATLLGNGNLQSLGFGQSRHHLIQRQETASLFGSVLWALADRLDLRVDGRISRETRRANQSIVFSGVTGPLLGTLVGEEEYALQARRSEFDVSPTISLLYRLRDNLRGYVTVARGFKSGGFNNLAAVAERAEFGDEQSRTYEAGLRLQTDNNLRGALKLFRTDFENLQVAALDGTEFFVGNAARAHTQGVELEARWITPIGLALSADLGYLDARYDRYENAPATADANADSQDLSGRVLQRAPRWSGSLQADVRVTLPWLGLPVGLGVVAEGASHQFLNIDLDPIDAQPGYVRYNAFVGIADRSERFSLRLIGRNLTDKVVRREAADVAIVGAHSVGLFPPRSVAAEIGYRF